MKRLLVTAVVLVGLSVTAPASAGPIDPVLGTPAPIVPDLSNPPTDGDSRHVCIIYDDLDFYRCVYIPMP